MKLLTLVIAVAPLARVGCALSTDTGHSTTQDATTLALSSQLQDGLTLDLLLRHTNSFQSIADNNNGTRVFGSKGHQETVNYIVNFVKQLGDAYEVHTEPMDLPYTEIENEILVLPDTHESIDIHIMGHSPSTPSAGLSTDLIHIADNGCLAANYENRSVAQKIALVQRGSCSFDQKARMAHDAEAVALLVYNDLPERDLRGTLDVDANSTSHAPSGGITQASGERLVNLLKAGAVRIDLTLTQSTSVRRTHNVIAETKEGSKSNVVVLGSHTDSVKAGPGVNDNGSGSATLLELARLLQSVKLRNAVRFCWWSAEEEGLLGAAYHVKNLSPEALRNIALYLNFDMIASPNYITGIYDGSFGTGNRTVPAGSAAITTLFENYFDGLQRPHDPVEFNGRSDYKPFTEAGIPAGGLFSGAEKNMTEEEASRYGGEAGKAYDSCYHQACDTAHNMNHQAFVLHARAVAHALATYAISTASVDQLRSPVHFAQLGAGAARNLLPVEIQDAYPVHGVLSH